MKVKVAQSCPTLYNSMDYTVHEILQARKLEWVAFPFSRGSSWPRNLTGISCIAGEFFTYWAIRETHVCHRVNIKMSFNLRWWKGIRVIALYRHKYTFTKCVYVKKKSHDSLFSQFLHSGRKALFLFFDWCDPAAEELVCWEAARCHWIPLTRIKDSTFRDSLSFKVWHLLSTHPMGKGNTREVWKNCLLNWKKRVVWEALVKWWTCWSGVQRTCVMVLTLTHKSTHPG